MQFLELLGDFCILALLTIKLLFDRNSQFCFLLFVFIKESLMILDSSDTYRIQSKEPTWPTSYICCVPLTVGFAHVTCDLKPAYIPLSDSCPYLSQTLPIGGIQVPQVI